MRNIDFKEKKVLIIEENDLYSIPLKQYISSLGGNVSLLNDWSILDQVVGNETFDLIVCDYSKTNLRATKYLLHLRKKYNYPTEKFVRTRWLDLGFRIFVKEKREKQNHYANNKNQSEDSNDGSENKSVLNQLKEIFQKENPNVPLFNKEGLFDQSYFIDEELTAYSYGDGKNYLRISILEISEKSFYFSSEDEIEIGEENNIKINYLINEKEKKTFEIDLKGKIEKSEVGPFLENLYNFYPSKQSEKEWVKIYQERNKKQQKVIDTIYQMKV